jgi:hypothetical protein
VPTDAAVAGPSPTPNKIDASTVAAATNEIIAEWE